MMKTIFNKIIWLIIVSGSPLVQAVPEHSHHQNVESETLMDHSHMSHGSAAQAVVPQDMRDPNGYGLGQVGHLHMMGDDNMGGVSVSRLERVRSNTEVDTAYEMTAIYGQPLNRAVFKSDGMIAQGKLQDARTELLWRHAVDAFWDSQLGLRNDSGAMPNRNWLAFGVQGIAPYWFNVEATAYFGESGRSALRVASEYDLLITQKSVLQPRLESNVYGQVDAARNLGSGLSDLAIGVRLRYEIRREFAPYVGVEWAGKFGGTADFARLSGEPVSQTRAVAGLKFWY
ncbi:MAG: copper resistance protein B [Gallionella sp.]